MKNMRVSRKLNVSFLLVILLTILVGAVGVTGMLLINTSSREMFEQQSQPLADLGSAREYFQRIRVQLRDIVLAGGDSAELNKIEVYLNYYERRFIFHMDAYKDSIFDTDMLLLYDDIMEAFDLYHPEMQQILASARAADPSVQMVSMMDALTEPTDFITEALDRMAHTKVLQASDVNETNNLRFIVLVITIIAVISVSITIASILAQRISEQISKPLNTIGSFVNKVSKGQISLSDISENSIDVSSADEIGMLARVLENSYVQLNEYEQSKTVLQRLAADNAARESLSRMKTEFFQNLNHDLKTPITVVSVNVADAADMLDFEIDKDVMRDILSNAQKETMRMARMVNNAMENATLQEEQRGMEPIDMAPILQEAADTCRSLLERSGNTLTVDVPPELPPVFGNTDMLVHVLSNLISNANRHTENGIISINASKVNGRITVAVADTGAGIKPELLPHIFGRGISDGGTGLGLSICKSIIEAHKGTITVKSKYGQGTLVAFSLPVHIDTKREVPEHE